VAGRSLFILDRCPAEPLAPNVSLADPRGPEGVATPATITSLAFILTVLASLGDRRGSARPLTPAIMMTVGTGLPLY